MRAVRKLKWDQDNQYVVEMTHEKKNAPAEISGSLSIFIDQLMEDWTLFNQNTFTTFLQEVNGLNLHVVGLFKAIDFSTMSFCNITNSSVFALITDASDNIYSEDFCDFM